MSDTTENTGLNDAIEVLEILVNYRTWILDVFKPHIAGTTIEIGAGSGSISERILAYTSRLILVEPSSELADRLETRLGADERIEIFNEPAEVFLPKAQTESTNAIIMVNVLEHIEDDGSALEYIYKILKPGGSLLLFVPALQFLYSQLDHDHGHFRRYSKSGLIKVACDAGFSIDQVQFIDLLGMMPWLVFNKWMKKTEFDENMVLLYDRYAVPVTKKIETLLGSPIGKNLILVAKKPASRN